LWVETLACPRQGGGDGNPFLKGGGGLVSLNGKEEGEKGESRRGVYIGRNSFLKRLLGV